MLEIGKAGSAGDRKELPVLRDGAVVATLRASSWRESATAVVGGTEWLYAKRERRLTGRRSTDPEDTARLSARQTSWWRGSWAVDLDGRSVEVAKVSVWRSAHRFSSAGRELGRSGTSGTWSPRPTLELGADVALDHQVFLLWVELVISRRNQAAVSAGAGAAVIGGIS